MSGWAIAAALALVGLGGCSGPPRLPDRAGPGPRASEPLVLSTLARDLEGFRTLRASVEGDAPQGSFSGAIFVDRERRSFRLYTWKLGGAIPIFDLLVHQRELRLLVPRNRKLLVRPVDDGEVAPAAPLRLEALVRGVLGPSARVTRTAPDGATVTETRAGRPSARFTVEARTLAVRRQEILDGDGRAELTIDYADHEALPDGRVVPRTLVVSRPGEAGDRSLTLRFADLVFDAPLDARKFEMRLPPETVEVRSFEELELE